MKRRGRGRRRGGREDRPLGGSLGGEELDARLKALNRASGHHTRKRRRRKKGNRRAVVVMVLMLAVVVFGVYWLVSAAFGEDPAESTTVSVEDGETLAEVADEMEEAGIVGSSTMFKLQARVEGGDTEIKPGEYRIERGASAETILATLSSEEHDVSTYAVTVPEGLTVSQTARAVEEGGGPPAAEFEKAAGGTDYGYAFLEDPAIKSTEGFLFPKRYEFEKGTDARGIVNRLLEQYLLETEGLDFAGARERLNLTEYQLVIVASLVEKESANAEERPVIASVIYNRLREDMPLQIDASVQYALDEPKQRLSLEDLEVDSPYNTYANRGLPPGPIATPSRESLEAALEPARTDHLYYVLEAGGKKHFFTNDYDEFLAAKEEAGH